MSYSEQVRKDAKAAADYIREHGWCQGEFANSEGACCGSGARNAVIHGHPAGDIRLTKEQRERNSELRIAMCDIAGTRYFPSWNDAKGRTKEEVLEVFDRIANSTTP